MESEALLRLKRERGLRAGALAAVDRPKGQRTPNQRIADVVDDGSFFEIAAHATSQLPELRVSTPTDGVVAGFGRIAGREVGIIVDDPDILRLTDGTVGRNKRVRILMHALQGRVPVLYIGDGGGYHRADLALDEGRLLGRYSDRSAVWPELDLATRETVFVSVILGPCAGQEASFAIASDVVIAVSGATLAATPSDAAQFAQADIVTTDESDALAVAASLFDLLPEQRNTPLKATSNFLPALDLGLVDDPPARAVLEGLLDKGTQVAWQGLPPSPLHIGLGRIEGIPVAYALGDDTNGLSEPELERLGRIAALANRLALPLLLIQHGAAYDDEAASRSSFLRSLSLTVAALHDGEAILLSIITRRGHALGDFVLGGRDLGTSYVIAWPDADVAVSDVPAFTRAAATQLRGVGPWEAAGLAVVDDVLEPGETRSRVAGVLDLLVRGRDYPKAHSERAGRIPFR